MMIIPAICPLLLLLRPMQARAQAGDLGERLRGSGDPFQLAFIWPRTDGLDDNNVYTQTPSQNEDDKLVRAKLKQFDAALDVVCVYKHLWIPTSE